MDGFIGEIRLMAITYVPMGWLACDGTAYPQNQYQALFAVIGTTYGGTSTTFKVPDLRGMAAVGVGQCPTDPFEPALGSSDGATQVTLTTSQVPPHNHSLVGGFTQPSNRVATATGNWLSSPSVGGTTPETGYGFVDAPTGAAVMLNQNALTPGDGAGGAHNNVQPYLCVQYFICNEGLFPVRP